MKIQKVLFIIVVIIVVGFLIYLGSNSKWVFEKVVGSTIYFSNNQSVKVDLYDLEYVGQLQAKAGIPYLILSGRDCRDCDENIAVYVYSPKYGLLKDDNGLLVRYSYPGKVFFYENNSLIFESRMFFGECIKDLGDSIVWIQKELTEGTVFKESEFIVEIENGNLKETFLKDNLYSISDLEKSCNELPGKDQVSEP